MVFNEIKLMAIKANALDRFLQSHLPNTTSGNNDCSNNIPKFFQKIFRDPLQPSKQCIAKVCVIIPMNVFDMIGLSETMLSCSIAHI